MKTLILYLLILTFGLNCSAQNFQLHLIGSSDSENKTIDSIGYISEHKEAKSIRDEIIKVSETLLKMGFLQNQILENSKPNDSTFSTKFNLGERIKTIHIYIGRKKPTQPSQREGFRTGEEEETENNNRIIKDLISLDKNKDTLVLSYTEVESFLNQTLQKLEQKGFALAKLKLINIKQQKNTLYADLQFESDKPRRLNAIVIKYADENPKNSFPNGHLKQINRKYNTTIFNQEVVQQIHDDFEKFEFVSQIKYPEILFTKDTTKVYVYLEKKKSNNFDGFIGFSNTENKKITFNGYLDVTLENALKSGEQISFYWKSDGTNQKTFKAGIELPYLFKSPIGLKAQIHIFKQDSIYQNSKTAVALGYYMDYNTRIYLGYQSTESSDIQNTNNTTISDYKNSYITSNIEFSKFDYVNLTFPKKSTLSLTIGFGKRKTNNSESTAGENKQFFMTLNAMHNFYLNKKNCINIKSQNYYLQSDNYIINELFRYGGNNSIHGFAENSLQASFVSSILTEYRYIVSPSLYVHSIVDYGYFQDKTTNNEGNLIGFGFGIGLQTKSGLLQFSLANGSSKNQEIKLYNTMVTICYNVKF